MDPNVSSQQAYTSMMKFTIDGRPFLRDIHDLFAALVVQIPFETHRYLFRNYYNTFTSEDAIEALGSLRFSHSVRVPDPNDSGRLQKTTTTTTFNMAREMAKTLCQQFQNCRLMENATDPQNRTFRDTKGLWHLTPKGLCVLQDFCVRTEVDVSGLRQRFSGMEAIQLARLERHADNDSLILNRACLAAIFQVMITSLPLEGSDPSPHKDTPPASSTCSTASSVSSDLPSLSAPFTMASSVTSQDSRVQLLGNYLLTLQQQTRRVERGRPLRSLFHSQMACDWLLDYSTTASREEAESLLNEWVRQHWLEPSDPKSAKEIKSSKSLLFVLTEKGRTTVTECMQSPEEEEQTTLKEMLQEELPITRTESRRPSSVAAGETDPGQSNSARLQQILENAKLLPAFKEFLRSNYCEENLDFWIDYNTLRRKCRHQSPALPSTKQKDFLEDAYDIWHTYLDQGAPRELNVEHALCQEMSRIMQSVVTVIPAYSGGGKPTILITAASASQSLRMMLKLLDKVNDHICRLMASDSVPKFVKTLKYEKLIHSLERAEKRKKSQALTLLVAES
ncbi:regulator of G protein signaling domain-containing protein [Sporodiniella umbellata]|nr:regulator of G protein signaling domain-containing protein [Sporodiniella umbellata]